MINLVLLLLGIYLLLGLVFSIVFALAGITRVDPVTRGSPILLRAALFPGVVALWPMMAWKWKHAQAIDDEVAQ